MNPILNAGVVIGALCALWTFVMGFTGWYKDPAMANMFFVVVLLEVGGLVWGLRQTAREGRTYGGQIVAGTLMAIIGGVIIIVSTLIFTMVLFPDALETLGGGREGVTPMSQALEGFLWTLVTGILASAAIALTVRAKPVAGGAR
jgi:hypothetical protein